MFEEFFVININNRIIDLYYESLIQAGNSIYQKDKDLKITKSQWIVDLFKQSEINGVKHDLGF